MEYLIIFFLISLSAIFSGLTLGFFSLNKDDLKRKAELKNKDAVKIYKIRENGNLLLCTLLIGNVAVNSALSIFLSSITSGVVGGIIATGMIVIFGEIVPQATFSRYALTLGSKLAWLVKVLIFIFYPICSPLAWLLDKALGEEIPTIYSKKELAKLIEEHEDSEKSDLDADEERIIKGALSFSHKTVRDIMTPRTEIVSLHCDQALDNKTQKKIKESGRSRIVVYKKDINDIIGILYVKDLVSVNLNNKTVKNVIRKKAIFVDDEKPLDDLLNAFKKTRNHLFIALNEFGEVSGIVTIEDVVEEIMGVEIVDEFDTHVNLQEVAKRKADKKKMKIV